MLLLFHLVFFCFCICICVCFCFWFSFCFAFSVLSIINFSHRLCGLLTVDLCLNLSCLVVSTPGTLQLNERKEKIQWKPYMKNHEIAFSLVSLFLSGSKRSASFFQDNKYTSFSFSFQIQLKVVQISDNYFRNMQAVRSEYSREIEREREWFEYFKRYSFSLNKI